MKLKTTILAALAILAVAASGASASGGMIPRDSAAGADRVAQRATLPNRAVLVIRQLEAKNQAVTKRLNRLAAKNRAMSAQHGDMLRNIRALNRRISDLLWAIDNARYPRPVLPVPVITDQERECIDYMIGCTPEQECLYWGVCIPQPEAGGSAGESSGEATEPEAPMSDELPALDSSDLPDEVTGEVEIDELDPYYWEG